MKKHLATILLIPLLALAPAAAATPLFVTPDVPTTVGGGTTLLPWEIWRYDTVGPVWTLQLTVPGEPHLDAIHKLDLPGSWLFSVESANDLGGALPAPAEPQDVVLYDGTAGTYTVGFCGALVGIPPEVNVDSVHLDGGDAGDLVLGFDVPVELPPGSGTYFEPADLVRFEPTPGGGCDDWVVSPVNPYFDASASGFGVPLSDNGVGGDESGGAVIFVVDVPSDLAPSLGPATYVPGQIVSWDGANFNLFESLVGWPDGSIVDGLSCQANPGALDQNSLLLGKSGLLAVLSWSSGCSSGADDYGIYEGTIAALHAGTYDHVRIDCNDAAPTLTETIAPAAGDRYYLVVPNNTTAEGSYGTNSALVQRPQPAAPGDRCVVVQNLTPCP